MAGAELPADPTGLELEDYVAAHFLSRGCYVETGVKERSPDELLELDIVWTNYRVDPPTAHPVEVKSGDWGVGDVFKFFGWTNYLGIEPGQFIFRQPCGRLNEASLAHLEKNTKVRLLHMPDSKDLDKHLTSLGLPTPASAELPDIWRFAFWAQRRLLKSLNEAIKQGIGRGSAKVAKEYHQLINDAVFFVPDVRDRIGDLLGAHLSHQQLGRSFANELESGTVELATPPETQAFRTALYNGRLFPVQACLYLAHRARLYILKALIDYWLAVERGDIPKRTLKFGRILIDFTSKELSQAMVNAVDELSAAKSFRYFGVFWQVFLWSWGGFLLTDRIDEEYAALAEETGVSIDEIPLALTVFDKIFPVPNGWFRTPANDSRRVLMLMPAAMRGIGAHRRRMRADVKSYTALGYNDATAWRMTSDNDAAYRLLTCADKNLVK